LLVALLMLRKEDYEPRCAEGAFEGRAVVVFHSSHLRGRRSRTMPGRESLAKHWI